MKRKLLAVIMSCAVLAGVMPTGVFAADGTAVSEEAAAAIEERKESGEIPTLVVAFMNWSGSPKGLERVEEKMSEYTEETLGVRVKLEIMDSASYGQEMTLMLASGEQVDVFNTVYVG